MAMMRLRYVHSFVDKTGRVRYYFRHRGKRWPLSGVPGSTEFSLRYDQLSRECAVSEPRNDNIHFAPHTLACPSRLKDALDHAERKSDYILTTLRGGGYSPGALSNMIIEATRRIGAKEYTAHGLRKNAAIALAEADCTVQQIMAITGHKTWKEAMRYTQRREQRKLAQQAVDKLEVANPRTIGQRRGG
jgi:hypothetical protein